MTRSSAVSYVAAAVAYILFGAGGAAGQTGTSSQAPSTAVQPYQVLAARSLDDVVRGLQPGNAVKNLVQGGGIGCRVFVQHEKDVSSNQAEVHDAADDIFIILEGTATLTMGGKLDSPSQAQPGEWRAAGINGGKEFKVGKGDVIVVPRGTAHRRTTAGQEVTLMVIKSFAPAAK